jgi:hypothetical protein
MNQRAQELQLEQELKSLREAAARLLVADPGIERMRVLAPVGRRQEEEHAAAAACFLLDRVHERPSDPAAAVTLVDDERPELADEAVVLERGGDLEPRECDDTPVEVCDEQALLAGVQQDVETPFDLREIRWVAKLGQESRDIGGVNAAGRANLHGGSP